MAISLTRVETPRRKWSALRPLQNHWSGNRDDGIFVEKFHQRPKKSWRQDHIGVQKEKIPAAKVFPVLMCARPYPTFSRFLVTWAIPHRESTQPVWSVLALSTRKSSEKTPSCSGKDARRAARKSLRVMRDDADRGRVLRPSFSGLAAADGGRLGFHEFPKWPGPRPRNGSCECRRGRIHIP
jgi:hypothetical protein